MTHILSISELYDKRKKKQKNISVGRVINVSDCFGIFDATGILWPVSLDLILINHMPKAGDVIKFRSCYDKKNLQITQILDVVFQIEEWKNKKIKNPMEIDESLFKKLNKTQTNFFSHPTLSMRVQNLTKRNLALKFTQSFFEKRGFFHAITPILVPSGGMENYLHTFQTQYHDFHGRMWTYELPTSPEFALKKCLAEGFPKVFQIAHSFRNNGEKSVLHEPEFFMLEWYRSGATLNDILKDTQNFVNALSRHLKSKKILPKIWPRFTVNELFIKLLNLNLDTLQNVKDFYEQAKSMSLSIVKSDTWDDIFCKLFMEKIEPFLKGQVACFVTDYPIQMGALAQQNSKNPNFVERAEAYLFGIEISNGYQELVDAYEFEKRFQKTQQKRKHQLKRDAEFENAMKFGLPPCAGNALGFDRVVSLLLGFDHIQNVILFPFQN